jgi:hypothetical protein
MHFHGFSNKDSPRAHMESELSVLGVAGKLGKNHVYGCQIIFYLKNLLKK